ncbi:hypothetical protein AGABI2DRAFT_119155 [Agaricus bisporus var. bisporus H97]|uniref:hypothetical protein n=1 Tax=Agaricus bisporus var. bisporus (strain H97 / ATCC MYA-4626 / FGSC 10389) TaxID=936046 RepID=UPI00029F50F8|nr:hypothetical protein AGABI2DRAFT_119155 [Agaricus bisporus var. bisporus H97]EKV45479.1 hypothetical protein AGABI2DRAFT_119155 [Agaricus bisporus var. bisporus H97]
MHSQSIPTNGTIRYLTTLLSQANFRDFESPGNQRLSNSMAFLAHISTMLNITYSGVVVAVTGQLKQDLANAVIVMSKDSPDSPEDRPFHVEPTSITATKFEPREIRFLTADCDESVLFVQHVKDLIGVLELSRKSEVHHLDVARWLIHRCHRKLSYRVQLIEREWKTSPTVTMKAWEPTDSDREFIESHPRTIVLPTTSKFMIVLKDVHITALTLNSVETAKMFICGIADLLTSLHRIRRPKGLKETRFEDIEAVVKVLVILEGILDDDVIHYIITKSSLSRNFQLRGISDEGTTQSDNDAGMKTELKINDSEDLADDDDEIVGTQQMPGEGKGEQVFRYMRTLTAWITASRVVIGALRKLGKPLSASIVTLSDYSSEALSQMEELQDDIIGQLKAELAYSTWLDRQAERLRKSLVEGTVKAPRVHAEAGLMALAKVARDGTTNLEPQEVKEVFMADPVLIGVSKKCCYMCSLLGQALSAGSTADFNGVIMQLPGTHGHMFSWDPPQFGVSQSVLDELADNLKRKVVELAERHAPDQAATILEILPAAPDPDSEWC